jgi:hypothetical protein
LTTPNIAVFAPMPNASVVTASSENSGARRAERTGVAEILREVLDPDPPPSSVAHGHTWPCPGFVRRGAPAASVASVRDSGGT